MATASTYAYGGFPFGVDLNELIAEALQVYCRFPSYSHLGTTTDEQNKRMADIVNRSVLSFLRAVPNVGQSFTGTITTVADQANYSVPTDLQGLNILRLAYTNTGSDSVNDNRQLQYLSRQQLWNLPPEILNGTIQKDFPDYWSPIQSAKNRTALTGTVTVTSGSAALAGASTLFTTELAATNTISIYGQTMTVGSITNPTSLTMTSAWSTSIGTQTGVKAWKLSGAATNDINLYPWPNASGKAITVTYQIRPPLVTYTDVANRATVPYMIDSIPIEYQGVLAMRLAIDILTTEAQWPRKQALLDQYGVMIDKVQESLSAMEAQDNGSAQQPGTMSNLIDTDSIFAGMQSTYSW